jgi:uncharacterized protein (TIGR03435 family)
MQAMDDMALLREYAGRNSETAFEELVARRVGFVYSAALRQVRDSHRAEEITQAVFIILAQKAGKISDKTILAGWLFKTTRYAAIAQTREIVKRSLRTATLEKEFQMQTELQSAATDPLWEQMSPLLDEALAALGETDRQAVLLRFFENKSLAEVGRHLGTGEDTARKRVARALEKLHRYFRKRGVLSTTAIIAVALAANSVQAAPMTLAKTVTAVALAKGAAASGSTLTLIKGALKIMAWTKAKTTIVVGVSLLLAAGTATVVVKEDHKYWANAWETETFNTNIVKILKATPPLVEIRPAKFPRSKGWAYSGGVLDQKMAGVSRTLKVITDWANTTDLMPDRHIFPDDMTTNEYDFIVNLPTGSSQALQKKIEEQFGLMQKVEIRETNVFLLKLAYPNAQGLKLHKGPPNKSGWSLAKETSTLIWNDMTMTNLARFLEMYLATPVIDRTGASEHFDINLKLNMDEFPADWKDHHLEDFQPVLLTQLGLELVPSREPIEMLVVEKAK